jgi:hypothetical protein
MMDYNQTILLGDRSQRLTDWFGCREEACKRGFNYLMGLCLSKIHPTLKSVSFLKVTRGTA